MKSIKVVLRTKADKEGKDPLATWRAEAKESVTQTGAFVLVDFTLSPELGSDIKCRAELPLPEKWDGRMWGQGNSGRAGSVRALGGYVASGTAAVTTDLGTGAVAGSGAPATDIVWPAPILRDFHWRATHLMTVYGKKIVEAFYGKPPKKSYFAGGSTGGRQAMSEAMATYNTKDGPKVGNVRNMVMGQWPRTATSGVPYDFYLAEDAYREPEILKNYKAVALGAFLVPDARQKALMAKLDEWGVKSFVMQPNGYTAEFFNSFVKDAGGYAAMNPGVAQVDMNGDFVSIHCIVPGKHCFRLPFPAKVVNVKSGREEKPEGGVLKLEMSAGETCWFRLCRIDKPVGPHKM